VESRGPQAMKAPVDLLVIQQDEESKWAMAFESAVRELMEMSRTLVFRMYSVLSKIIDAPRATRILISLMPMAGIEDLRTPFTEQGSVGRSERKSERSGEMWTEAPESTMKGKSLRDIWVRVIWFKDVTVSAVSAAGMVLVFKGPVYRTEKKTETGLNWTD
jgi:hypothetical protein